MGDISMTGRLVIHDLESLAVTCSFNTVHGPQAAEKSRLSAKLKKTAVEKEVITQAFEVRHHYCIPLYDALFFTTCALDFCVGTST